MKKSIVLLSALFVMVYGEHEAQESFPICMNWKGMLMMHWQSLSSIHKLLLVGLIALVVIWVAWRIIQCGKGGCGCHCKDKCTCKI